MIKFLLAFAVLLSPLAHAAGGVEVDQQEWSFTGFHDGWDKHQLYRGFTVATQVCMACHSFKYISPRTMMEKGGFTEAEAKALAVELNMDWQTKLISGLTPEDAQEIYGKPVPDLSMMNKARAGLADYIYAVLTGYSEDEETIHHAFPEGLPAGTYYNAAFPGHAIAMPPPIAGPDMVEYHDDTTASVEQMAKDVTYFMQWTAEPELLARKRLGVYVLIYLVLFSLLAYFAKRAIWRDVK